MIKENIQQYIPENIETKIYGNSVVFEIYLSQVKEIIGDLYNKSNLPLKIITATDEREEGGCFKIWYVFGVPKENIFLIAFIKLKDTIEFPSVADIVHEAWNYERRIKTFFGLTPVGHPDLRPIILHENWPENIFPLRKDFNFKIRPKDALGVYKFNKVKGEGIYEIPVGPIHAGIIEPGHFRFSVLGEKIMLLEPKLGYVHKGSEKLFETFSIKDKLRLAEKISGDSSFSHSLAFCQALEQLSDLVVPERALYLRVIYAELERLANHFGDIGAIMIDTGFNFGGAQGARLREIVMQINEKLTGSRFLRGTNVVGGVTKDIQNREKNELSVNLENIKKDFSEVVSIAENNISLFNRLDATGTLSFEIAKDMGVLGVPAKAVGIQIDARVDYPYAAYKNFSVKEFTTKYKGDVYARFSVRIKEAFESIDIIENALAKLPEGLISAISDNLVFKKDAVTIGIVEGWRGDIIYFVTTDSKGSINRVAPRDPSFINWNLLKDAGFDNVVPDFPLINKSFNLSYSGNDL